jgi:hypothetical protein
VVPAGGLSLDHTRWVHSPDNYFLPKAVLRKVFRGKFVAGLRQAFQNGELRFPEKWKLLCEPKIFAAWLRPLFRQPWVVYLINRPISNQRRKSSVGVILFPSNFLEEEALF